MDRVGISILFHPQTESETIAILMCLECRDLESLSSIGLTIIEIEVTSYRSTVNYFSNKSNIEGFCKPTIVFIIEVVNPP